LDRVREREGELVTNTELDWKAIAGMLEACSALAAAVAVCVTAWFGSRAFATWRAESTGRRKSELAEEVLACAYEAVEIIKRCRTSLSSDDEGATFPIAEGVPDGFRDRARMYFAPAERLSLRPEFWARLETLQFRVKPFFGASAVASVRTIIESRGEIYSTSATLARYTVSRDLSRVSNLYRQSLEARIWGSDDPEEPMNAALDAAILNLEFQCGSALSM
jgi:hypothetical protein